MSTVINTKSPVFWVVVFAGAILPTLGLHGIAQVAATLFVVAFVVTGFVLARRPKRTAAAERR
ncbi:MULTISPECIES: hypothetical protein [Catenuloplanes]|uniref:Threonine/homoserine/homoserine lactone efflux protein n=1 Tax=Catenuloplanes niger TaxID=587534 RepID=A0AAE3ZWS7_9ACTN|nr:hypothetical protein [Catenuloplanes niger]MDR7326619.1 threonine/homoserine/homoserine lactone efflux protein [Catenuloplanes niger]